VVALQAISHDPQGIHVGKPPEGPYRVVTLEADRNGVWISMEANTGSHAILLEGRPSTDVERTVAEVTLLKTRCFVG
jgi:hypothetical protein